MTLVMLHDDGGKTCYVNQEFVGAVVARGTASRGTGSTIYVQGVLVRVDESPEQVAQALQGKVEDLR